MSIESSTITVRARIRDLQELPCRLITECIIDWKFLTGWGLTHWLSLEDHMDCRSLAKDPSLWSVSKCLLKLLTDVAHTVALSRLFHILMTRSQKKCCRKSSLARFLTNFNILHDHVEYSKKVLNLIDDSPWIILNTSMRSALVCLSSKDHIGSAIPGCLHMEVV